MKLDGEDMSRSTADGQTEISVKGDVGQSPGATDKWDDYSCPRQLA